MELAFLQIVQTSGEEPDAPGTCLRIDGVPLVWFVGNESRTVGYQG